MKKLYYPEEFKGKKEKDQYEFCLMELEEDLEEKYGYMAIDFREENVKDVEEIEVCGYPGDKDPHTMWNAFGEFKIIDKEFLSYRIPTFRGQSGSPIIKREKGREYVIGVHFGSYKSGTRNLAIKLTPEKRKVINGWAKRRIGLLNLGEQGIGDEEMEHITKKWSEKVNCFWLHKNKISSKGLNVLAQGKWEKLKILDLSKW